MSDFEDDGFDDFAEFDEIPELEENEFAEFFTETPSQPNLRERTGNERLSHPILGKLAKAQLIATRSRQLELSSSVLPPQEIRGLGELTDIALLELERRVIPLKIVREFTDGTYEVWDITEFEYIAE